MTFFAWALIDVIFTPVGLFCVSLIAAVVGFSLGRSRESKRWARVATKYRFPAPAHEQTITYKGTEYVVLTQRRYLGMVKSYLRIDDDFFDND